MHEKLKGKLSPERLQSYCDRVGGCDERAMECYLFNNNVAASLYLPLQTVEVILRNCIHKVMMEAYGERWLEKPDEWVTDSRYGFNAKTRKLINRACSSLKRQNKLCEAKEILPQLSFGFWAYFLGRKQDTLWQTMLHRIVEEGQKSGVTRKTFSKRIDMLLTLRNRIDHHEPILHLKCDERYHDMLFLIQKMSPEAAEWCDKNSFFRIVYQSQKYWYGL